MSRVTTIENFDWLSSLNINTKMLRYIGLWPYQGRYRFDMYTFCAVIYITVFVYAHNFFIIMGILLDSENLVDLTARIFINSSQILTAIKAYYFMKNVRKLNQLSRSLRSHEFVSPKNCEQVALIKPEYDACTKAYYVYWVCSWATVTAMVLAPILGGSVKNYELPVQAWFPHTIRKSPNYEFTYLFQSLGTASVVATAINVDFFVMNLMMIAGMQCELLCDNLKNIKNVGSKFNQEFVDCIEHHRVILSFAQNSNESYNMLIFWQLSNTALSLAMTMFQMSLVSLGSSDVLPILAYTAAAAAQILMYCWFGNQLELKSSQIPYSAFESDWTGIPIEAKKNLLIFIMRAQRPIKMSAINLFSLSLATFTTILRTSWSYFAVLRQVNAQ